MLVTFKVIKDVSEVFIAIYIWYQHSELQTQYMTADDIVTGFSAIIETFEMMFVTLPSLTFVF